MKKTLGGERIGSGNKMTFDTKHFNRSSHDLSHVFRTTIAPGTLVPFLVLPTLPGDTFDIDLNALIHTLPAVGPLFGSAKLQLDVYQIPMRLYMRDLQMNKLEIGRDMSKVQFPQIRLRTNNISLGVNTAYSKATPWGGREAQNSQIEPSSILAYLGIKGLGNSFENESLTVSRTFNAMPWLMYWDIVKQYYANKMEDNIFYIHNAGVKQDDLVSNIKIYTNNTETTLTVNTPLDITIEGNIILRLKFASSEDFNLFMPEEWVLKLSDIPQEPSGTREYILTEKNFKIQAKADSNEYYYTVINQPGAEIIPFPNVGPVSVTTYSNVEWDYQRPKLSSFSLGNIDKMREKIMTKSGDTPLIIDGNDDAPYGELFYGVLNQEAEPFFEFMSIQSKQEGLALKTYQSDINNNWPIVTGKQIGRAHV